MNVDFILAGLVLWMISLFVFYVLEYRKRKKLELDVEELELTIDGYKSRDASLTQSRRTLKGKLQEELFPMFSEFPYLLSDMRFLGYPIDYIIFDGYSDAKDEGGEVKGIVFIDVKSNKSQLSTHQRKIRDAIKAGRVDWKTIRILDDGSTKVE